MSRGPVPANTAAAAQRPSLQRGDSPRYDRRTQLRASSCARCAIVKPGHRGAPLADPCLLLMYVRIGLALLGRCRTMRRTFVLYSITVFTGRGAWPVGFGFHRASLSMGFFSCRAGSGCGKYLGTPPNVPS